jgi:hypothetical protein
VPWYTEVSAMFIPPMVCTSLRDPSRLGDPCDVAEPKLDGQRAQIHVADGPPSRPRADAPCRFLATLGSRGSRRPLARRRGCTRG